MEWTKEQYNKQYERWVPWLEDMYLRLFTKDNKASYATKGELDKTKVTGVEGVDKLQDDVHHGLAGQLGRGGLGQPIGDLASREGVNRAERQGKDDKGAYAADPTGGTLTEGGKAVAGKAQEGVSAVGGAVGGLLGGGGGGAERK